jgi:hypothetical protein
MQMLQQLSASFSFEENFDGIVGEIDCVHACKFQLY